MNTAQKLTHSHEYFQSVSNDTTEFQPPLAKIWHYRYEFHLQPSSCLPSLDKVYNPKPWQNPCKRKVDHYIAGPG